MADNARQTDWTASIGTPAAFHVLWSFRKRAASDLNVLRAAQAAAVYRTAAGGKARGIGLRLLMWLVRFPIDLARCLIAFGGPARRIYKRSLPGQIADLLRLARTTGTQPRDYYLAGLAGLGGGDALDRFVPARLYETVAQYCIAGFPERVPTATIDDKALFAQACRARDVAHVPAFCHVTADRVTTPAGGAWSGPLPGVDLVLKPTRLLQGRAIERWVATGDGHHTDGSGVRLTNDALLAHARERAAAFGQPFLVQPYLRNHPQLESVAGDMLVTLRLITLVNERGEPELVHAMLRTLASPHSTVDNYTSGGIHFIVDVKSGRLGRGMSSDHGRNPVIWASHPATGITIEGRTMPLWDDARAFVAAAHDRFCEYGLIGWDIAITPDGVVAIEANFPPSMDPTDQIWHGGFIGSRVGDLLVWHARNKLAASEPAGSRWRPRGLESTARAGADRRYPAGASGSSASRG